MKFTLSCLFLILVSTCFAQQKKKDKLYLTKIQKQQLSEWFSPKGMDRTIIAAHRGGRQIAGYPENAIETFEYVLSHTPAIMECDVEMTSDSILILLHDNSLDRTTTGSGKIKETPWSIVAPLRLIDDYGDTTNFEVPTLEEALMWCKGKTVLELDVKRGVPFERVIQAVEKAKVEDYVVIITYNIDDAQKVYQLNPKLMISVSIRNFDELKRMQNAGIPFQNLIAFTGTRMSPTRLYQDIEAAGALTILGTLGNLDRKAAANGDEFYLKWVEKGVHILATDRPIEAAKAIGAIPTKKIKTKYYTINIK